MTELDSPNIDTPNPESTTSAGEQDPAAVKNAAPQPSPSWKSTNSLDLGAQLYDWRGHSTVLFALLLMLFAQPTAASATIGTLLIVWGELLRLYSAAYLGLGTWNRSPLPESGHLERQGPYAFVRHPLYAGNLLILSGFAVYSGVLWLAIVTVVALSFQYYCVARYEDSVLEDYFGDAFVDYLRTVPAWIPARPVSLNDLDWPASWSQAIATEKRTFLGIALLLIALLFLS